MSAISSKFDLTFPGINPIWQKSLRARLRLAHILSWGIITVTVTTFAFLMVYLTSIERTEMTSGDAAKATIPVIIIIQSVILMMIGTGAVASGISQERDEGLLDYQRMTPMSPTAKILGYLFGLPVREYALFALTLPFLLIAVIISGFDLLTLAHFYIIFFTSVWVYHLTGLVAGMVAPKPRLASFISMGLVFALYFILPNLSRLGITYFEFLTIRPTLFGLIYQELPESLRPRAEASGLDQFRDVPFFSGMLHPTIYSLLVQVSLLCVMYLVVWRKWRDETSHSFSKIGAVTVFSGAVFFLVASLWALIVQEDAYFQVFRNFDRFSNSRSPETLEILLFVFLVMMGGAFVLLVTTITPSRHKVIEGWRRAKKLARPGPGLNSDAASSLPAALAMLVIGIGAGAVVLGLAVQGGEYFASGPSAWTVVVFLSGCVGIALFTQGLREMTSVRVFGVGIFLLWMTPIFAMMILFAAFEQEVLGSYVGLPCPPVTLFFSLAQMLETTTPLPGDNTSFLTEDLAADAPIMTALGSFGYLGLGVGVQAVRLRRWRAAKAIGLSASTPAEVASETSPAI